MIRPLIFRLTRQTGFDIIALLERKGEPMEMYESEAKQKWQKENTVFIGVKLQKSTDADLIQYLDGKVKNAVIKAALREYIENHKGD